VARLPYAAKVALLAGAYYCSAKLGLALAFETRSVTAIWPPTGIALAALVLWGRRYWPGVALGALLANAWTGVPLAAVLGITAGNTLEALVGAYLLERARIRPSLEWIRDVLALVFLAAVLSTAVSATIGVASLLAGGEIDSGDLASVWRTWWLGDMGGDLVVAPLLLIAITQWPFRGVPGRLPEAALLGAFLAGISALVFSQEAGLTYLVFPGLVWAALRFWQPGAAAASFLVAAIAVWFTQDGSGPFVQSSPDDSLLLAQSFVGVSGITALLLATATSQRTRAEQAVRHIARTLEESLLPSSLPAIPAIDMAVRFLPAGEPNRVGGDFYDVFETGPGSWAIVVGDVTGKGPEAAAVTGLARHTIRAAAIHERRPRAVLRLLNDAIRGQSSSQELCSAVYARLDLFGPGGAILTLASGGHPLPLLRRAAGGVEVVGSAGMLLGVEADPSLTEVSRRLSAGDTLLLYTDGLIDAYAPANGYRPSDVMRVLEGCTGIEAQAVVECIERELLSVEGAVPRDDIALLVLRLT
jgi:integral membrane sensor domain MASE1